MNSRQEQAIPAANSTVVLYESPTVLMTNVPLHIARRLPAAEHDPLAECLRQTSYDHGTLTAAFGRFRLGTALQPIYSLAHQRPVGFEALVRPVDENKASVPPPQLFAGVSDTDELIQLDRLCHTVHVANFQALDTSGWLFLNVNPEVAANGRKVGRYLGILLEHFKLPAHQVVIEILEGAVGSEANLEKACEGYREAGCLIAIDDFGAGHSNFQRIWRLRPDIVKFDRSMIAECTQSNLIRRSLPSLSALLHEAGCLVLAEGVETEEQAALLIDANVDLAQGYLFARPFHINNPLPVCEDVLEGIHRRFVNEIQSSEDRHRKELSPYLHSVQQFVQQLGSKADLSPSVSPLLEMERALRVFILDEKGKNTHYFQSVNAETQQNQRLKPLNTSNGTTWYYRPYFRRAIAHPGVVQVTRPYLSLPDACMCQTVSLCVEHDGRQRVICLDITAIEL